MTKQKPKDHTSSKPKAIDTQAYNTMKFVYPVVSAIVAMYFKENIVKILSKNYEDVSRDAVAYCLPKIQKYAKNAHNSQFKKYALELLELIVKKEIDTLEKIKELQQSNQLPKTLTWYQTFLKHSTTGMQIVEGMAKSLVSNNVVDIINKYSINTTQQMLLLPAWVLTTFVINRITDNFRNYVPLPSDILKHALMESLKMSQSDIDISKEQEDKILELQNLIETTLGEAFKEVIENQGNSKQKEAEAHLEEIQNRIQHLTQTLQSKDHSKPFYPTA